MRAAASPTDFDRSVNARAANRCRDCPCSGLRRVRAESSWPSGVTLILRPAPNTSEPDSAARRYLPWPSVGIHDAGPALLWAGSGASHPITNPNSPSELQAGRGWATHDVGGDRPIRPFPTSDLRMGHEFMTPRSGGRSQEVNNCKADEVLAEHASGRLANSGCQSCASPAAVRILRSSRECPAPSRRSLPPPGRALIGFPRLPLGG